MAGEWLKFEKSTLDKPEVLAVAAALGWDADMAIGKFVRMWSWFDTHTVNGDARGVTPALLDSILRVTGFVSEVQKVGWLEVHEWGIRLPKFGIHCGETAKQRALGAKRNAAYRASNAKGDDSRVTDASPREEKRREEKKEQERTRGARLPADWKPSATETVWAENERPDVNVAMEAAKFADYWHGVPGAKGVKLDWTGTWRNWIRRADGVRSGGFAAPTAGTPRRRRELGA